MAVLALAGVALPALFAPHAPILLGVLLAALVLLTRWSETADRSAYVVGALCAIVAPVWALVVLSVALVDDPLFWMVPNDGDVVVWLVAWLFEAAGIVLVVALFVFAWRPVWITGLFLKAPQGTVRRRFKALESSWQFALGAVVLLAVLHYLATLIDL